MRAQEESESGTERHHAEACLQRAVQVARQQRSKSWELRVMLRLCHLWRARGERERTHRHLADVYGRFTERFGTPDLREARRLLEALA
jgi:adenylate cyclase